VDEGDRRGVDRLTIQEAARRLGVSEGAVRKRVTRGTLEHGKAEDGRVYVYLDTGVDEGVDEGVDPNNTALISQLREEVAYLRDENRRKDEIIMQQAMTMRQLSAAPPQETTEAAQTVEEEPERGVYESDTDPGRPQVRLIFGLLTVVGVGSAPWLAVQLADFFGELGWSLELGNLAYVLFALPFSFGVYSGRAYRKRQEFFARQPPSSRDIEFARRTHVLTEIATGLIVAAGAALVAIIELAIANFPGWTQLATVDFSQTVWQPALAIFIGSLSFFFFAFLIGVTTGGRQREGEARGRLTQHTPAILGVVGSIITLIATVIGVLGGGG
jgi:hypothetical protein